QHCAGSCARTARLPDAPPVRFSLWNLTPAYSPTGLLGAFGLGLGLLHRLRRGEGQRVETSLGHAATFLQLPYMQSYQGNMRANARKVWDEPSGPQATGWGPLQRLYCAADTWFFLGAQEAQIERLAAIPGLQGVQGLTGAALEAQLEESFRAR